jgi:hypothetical protein
MKLILPPGQYIIPYTSCLYISLSTSDSPDSESTPRYLAIILVEEEGRWFGYGPMEYRDQPAQCAPGRGRGRMQPERIPTQNQSRGTHLLSAAGCPRSAAHGCSPPSCPLCSWVLRAWSSSTLRSCVFVLPGAPTPSSAPLLRQQAPPQRSPRRRAPHPSVVPTIEMRGWAGWAEFRAAPTLLCLPPNLPPNLPLRMPLPRPLHPLRAPAADFAAPGLPPGVLSAPAVHRPPALALRLHTRIPALGGDFFRAPWRTPRGDPLRSLLSQEEGDPWGAPVAGWRARARAAIQAAAADRRGGRARGGGVAGRPGRWGSGGRADPAGRAHSRARRAPGFVDLTSFILLLLIKTF